MIFDLLKNSGKYSKLTNRLSVGLSFLSQDLKSYQPGKYEIDGSDVYAVIDEYRTKKLLEGKWEAHNKYIDIQSVLIGSELVGFNHRDNMNPLEVFNEENDVQFFSGSGNFMKLYPQSFVILFPDDAHMPGIAESLPEVVKKIVIKVKVD